MIHVTPISADRLYNVEIGRRSDVQCLSDSRVIPASSDLIISRNNVSRIPNQFMKRSVAAGTSSSTGQRVINVPLNPQDSGSYSCRVDGTQEEINIRTLGVSYTHTHTHTCNHTHVHTYRRAR